MDTPYSVVKLATILELNLDVVPVVRSETYPLSGVYSFGRGLIDREPLVGSDTSYKKLHRLHKDDIVLSKLKAWEGAIARVTEEFAGRYLSPQFVTFRVAEDKLDARYLEWYCKRPSLWGELRAKATGMGARRISVSPKQFLSLEIPLPPLEEQRRIVARIDELVARIEEARRLRAEAIQEVEALVSSLHTELAAGRTVQLGEILELDEDRVPLKDEEFYPQAGLRGFGNGLFEKESIKGSDTSYKRLNRLYAGAVVLSQLKGWEGAIAVCDENFAGRFVSPEYRTFRCITGMADPRYLARLVSTEWF